VGGGIGVDSADSDGDSGSTSSSGSGSGSGGDQDDQKEVWRKLDYADYEDMADESSGGGERDGAVLNLPEYRRKGTLDLKLKVASVAPRVFVIDNFLSQVEVDHLLEMARVFNTTTNPGNANDNGDNNDDGSFTNKKKDPQSKKKKKKKKKKKPSSPSTESNTNTKHATVPTTDSWIHREFSPVVDAIYRRTADLLHIDESLLRHRSEHSRTSSNTHHSLAEAVHVDRYGPGQGYPARHDCSQPERSLANRYQPQRFATVLLMLSDVVEGGDTVFPRAVTKDSHDGVRVGSQVGRAVLYYNVLPDGNMDDLCHHEGDLVVDGEKWTGTLWVWDPIID